MSVAAPAWRMTTALFVMELRLLARRGENVLVALVLPVAVLAFFGLMRSREESGTLLAAVVSLAVLGAGFVSLGIATAYERSYGVLKRLAGAPVSRVSIIVAKLASVLVVAFAATALLVPVAVLVLGWAPSDPPNPVVLAPAIALGVVTFGGLGLTLASVVRAEAALALANGAFLVFVLLGGIVVPIAELPEALRAVAALLPSTVLTDAVAAGLGVGGSGAAVLPLLAWAVAGLVLASLAFRSE